MIIEIIKVSIYANERGDFPGSPPPLTKKYYTSISNPDLRNKNDGGSFLRFIFHTGAETAKIVRFSNFGGLE
jgi:hypothetical protein